METQITIIGSATRDIFLIPKKVKVVEGNELICQKMIAFEYGAKTDIEELKFCVGGTAVNLAVGLKRQGIKTAVNCAVGDDEAGKKVLEVLKREGVEVLQVPKKGLETDDSVVVVDKETGERTILAYKSAGRELEINCELLKAKGIYVSSLKYGWETKLLKVKKCVVEGEKRLFFNPGTKQVQAGVGALSYFLKEVEVIFMNEDEALEFTEQVKNPGTEKVAKEIESRGPKVVVVTAGEKGASVYGEGKLITVPSKKVDAKDVTGAGDAFASGFLADYLKRKSLLEAAKNGIRNSLSVIGEIGTLDGLMRSKERPLND